MSGEPRRVVVTGVGQISAAGSTVDAFWDALVSGRSAIRRITRFDVSAYPTQIAAELGDLPADDLAERPAGWMSRGRIAQYAAIAASRAIEDAALDDDDEDASRRGVAIASGLGTYEHAEVVRPCGVRRTGDGRVDWSSFAASLAGALAPRSAERRTPGSVAALLACEYGFRGPVMSVMTACAGGTQALGDAARWIRTGRADVVLAGGADSELYPMGLASFCLLGALSRRNDAPAAASRPFDAGRDGVVLGEGAGMLVLEERRHAVARGARIYAELAGFGSACDAHRVTDPHPAGRGAVLAMRRALDDAQVTADGIGYINAHGTSTAANDRAETLAIKSVFGERAYAVPVSSTKSIIGHATVAAGAIEAIATVLTLVHQIIHPTINQEHPDPACDLDYVPNHARAAAVDAALSNSFAFGGQTACLVFRRHHG